MRKSLATRLPLDKPLPYAVYHESGQRLHDFDEVLKREHQYLMQEAGIRDIYLADKIDNPDRVREDLRIKQTNNIGLIKHERIARPVYSEEGRLIVDTGTVVDDDTIVFLMKNNIAAVWVPKSDSELKLAQVTKYRNDCKKYIEGGKLIPGFSGESVSQFLGNLIGDLMVVSKLESKGQKFMRVPEDAEPLLKRLPPLDPSRARTQQEVEALKAKYDELSERTEILQRRIVNEEAVKQDEVQDIVGAVIKAVLADRALLLGIVHQPRTGEYLFTHTINTMALSVVISIMRGYSDRPLRELASAAFFHDIGMLLVPDRIRSSDKPLSSQDQAEVRNHPTYSVRLAARVPDNLEMVPLIVYQTHEMIDGSGYPRARTDKEIHDLAKIIGVASMYSALVSHRPHRAPTQPYKAIEKVIHLAGQRKYDSNVVRALLKSVNLFPVGTWVRMTDGSIGVATMPNMQEYARPYVKVMFHPEGKNVGKALVKGTTQGIVRIDRAIEPPAGRDALEAFYS